MADPQISYIEANNHGELPITMIAHHQTRPDESFLIQIYRLFNVY